MSARQIAGWRPTVKIARSAGPRLCALAALLTLQTSLFVWGEDADPAAHARQAAMKRTVAYLSEQVTTWNQDHACYSCHNNGDAIRALLVARGNGLAVDTPAVEATVTWLRQPDGWSRNGPDGEFNDRRLAQLQFASALAAAESLQASEHRPLQLAAEPLAGELLANGAWPSEQVGTIGSPITYGPFLALIQARNVLHQAGPRFSGEVKRANRWLRAAQPKSVLNAAAVLWGLAGDPDPDAAATRMRCLTLIRRGESRDGGWGPYVTSATEPFDTAVVILALHASAEEADPQMLERGQEYLLATQLPDGSWPETTRPADRESYAHRISTTAWCLQALVTTSDK